MARSILQELTIKSTKIEELLEIEHDIKRIIRTFRIYLVQGSEDVEISTLVYDSRKIEKGSVFVCISGAAFDGHKFVAQAAELGAAAVVVEKDVEVQKI